MNRTTHTSQTIRSFSDPKAKPAANSRGLSGLKSLRGTPRRRASAFTLVETAVATLLAAVMLPAIYASTAAGFALVQVTRENMRATQIILQRMEGIRLSSYKLIQDPTSYPTN